MSPERAETKNDNFEQAPPPSCELQLGAVALCASCPLLRILGDCPKNLSAPETVEFYDPDSFTTQEPQYMYETVVVADSSAYNLPLDIPIEQPIKESLADKASQLDKQDYYRQQLFDDSVEIVSIWEPEPIIEPAAVSPAEVPVSIVEPLYWPKAKVVSKSKRKQKSKPKAEPKPNIDVQPATCSVLHPDPQLPSIQQPKQQIPQSVPQPKPELKPLLQPETKPELTYMPKPKPKPKPKPNFNLTPESEPLSKSEPVSESKPKPDSIQVPKPIVQPVRKSIPEPNSRPISPISKEHYNAPATINTPQSISDTSVEKVAELQIDYQPAAEYVVDSAPVHATVIVKFPAEPLVDDLGPQIRRVVNVDSQEYLPATGKIQIKHSAIAVAYLWFGSVALARLMRYV